MIDERIKRAEDCTGCFACVNVCPQQCINMKSDAEGFWYPQVDREKCVGCLKCVDSCASLNICQVDNHPLAYACINNNQEARKKSSSGGVFSLVAEHVLADGGVVYGVKLDDQLKVVHGWTDDKAAIEDFRGSKYVQSIVGSTFKQVKDHLLQGRKVLFSGTPCQVSGLKFFLGENQSRLFTMDIICHGVPSPKVWQKYINYQERRAASSVKEVSFREKSLGWRTFSMEVLFDNNAKCRRNLRDDFFLRAFLKNICLRPSCYDCKFKSLHRMSDITMGDFWGIQHILPELDDDKGTSLVFLNTVKGQNMFEAVENALTYKPVNIYEAVRYNSAAVRSVKCNPNRELFFADLDKVSFDKLIQKYCRDKFSSRMRRKVLILGKAILRKIGMLKKKIIR